PYRAIETAWLIRPPRDSDLPQKCMPQRPVVSNTSASTHHWSVGSLLRHPYKDWLQFPLPNTGTHAPGNGRTPWPGLIPVISKPYWQNRVAGPGDFLLLGSVPHRRAVVFVSRPHRSLRTVRDNRGAKRR